MRGSWMRGLRAVADIFLPRVCVVCGRRLSLEEKHICGDCLEDMPLTRFHLLKHNPMADKFNSVIQKHLETLWASGRSDVPYERYAFATALFFYDTDNGYRHIPYQIKYHDNLRLGRHFGKMLGDEVSRTPWLQDVDMIIPVPLHWRRRWSRGYNQAEVIAREVALSIGAPLRTDLLKRTRYTKTQTQLSPDEKVTNVSRAFSASRPDDMLVATENMPHGSGNTPQKQEGIPVPPNGFLCHHILLIDDVFTTGSTLCECFWALREEFPPSVRISVATLGFVGR